MVSVVSVVSMVSVVMKTNYMSYGAPVSQVLSSAHGKRGVRS